jgi:hypothetical protein
MKKDGEAFAWQNKGATARDGADISSGDYNNQTWWSSNSPDGPAFTFGATDAWEWGTTDLPILRGFTGTQEPTVTPHTTAFITITVDQMKDINPSIDLPNGGVISKNGENGPTSITLTLGNPGSYDTDSIKWTIPAIGVGQNVTGTGTSFTVDANNTNYNSLDWHTITLVVRIDGVPYSKIIEFKIVE